MGLSFRRSRALVRVWLGIALFASGAFLQGLQAEVTLPHVFGAHMVLQQDKPVVLWGWAQPNETVTVRLASASVEAQANERGEWKAVLPAMKAGGPYTLEAKGSSTVRLDDVLVGEMWLCSGQSNMEMGIGAALNAKEEIAAADYPNLRLLLVTKKWAPQTQRDIEGVWKVCSPQTVAEGGWAGFSAAAYYFGRELNKQLGVPVGLIDSSWGGTRIEPWTPPEGFAAVPALKREYEIVQLGDPRSSLHQQRMQQALQDTEGWLAAARQALTQRTNVAPMPALAPELLGPHDVQNPTALYNGMIYPLCPFPIRGALWYQGESNLGEGMLYAQKMKALIGGWRQLWNEGDFPFYFVQIAPYTYGGNPQAEPELWEAQAAAAQTIPNCGMAVINDLGDLKDIHPKNKQDVGRRLAFLALARTYGRPDVVSSAPTFKSMSAEGPKLRVVFHNAEGGLKSRDGKPLSWFEVIDADEGGFVKADAQIDGSAVVLSAPGVARPVAMRFAWSMLAEPNLANAADLPAGAFRAGEIPNRDMLARNVPEAKNYHLVYDLDLAQLGHLLHYSTDNHASISGPIDRIAYCLQLENKEGDTKFVYVSMDAFTQDLDKAGVPLFGCGARFQQDVSNLNVYSNVKGIVTGQGLAGGNIEFWPDNYGPGNAANVPNASGDIYDFGDQPSDPAEGYGSMQVHNHDARQTLFALNHWSDGANADAGIGNQPTGNPDWTFAKNAGTYLRGRLRVLVHSR